MGYSREESYNYCFALPRQEVMTIPSHPKHKRRKERHIVIFQADDEMERYESQPLSREEIEAQWYSQNELISIMTQYKESINAKDEDDCNLHGIEYLSSKTYHPSAYISIQAVVNEQDRLRQLGEAVDSKRLQHVYQKRSAYRQRIAHLRALGDAAESNEENENNDVENDCLEEETTGVPPKYEFNYSWKRFNIIEGFRVRRERRRIFNSGGHRLEHFFTSVQILCRPITIHFNRHKP